MSLIVLFFYNQLKVFIGVLTFLYVVLLYGVLLVVLLNKGTGLIFRIHYDDILRLYEINLVEEPKMHFYLRR